MHESIKQKIQHAFRIDQAVRIAIEAAPGLTAASFILQLFQGILPLAAL